MTSASLRRLKERETSYRHLFECAADAQLLIDARTWRIEDAHEAATLLYGYSRQEFRGMETLRLSAEPEASREMLTRLSAGIGRGEGLRRHLRHDGTEFPVEIRSSSFETGGRRLIIASIRDLAESTRARLALEESERRFREMAESISQVFWMTDPQKKVILYVSPAYESIWGRRCEDLYADSRAWLDAVHPEDRERVKAGLARQARDGYDVRYRVVRPDGGVRWIHDRAYPVRDESGAAVRVAGVAQDITETKLAEDAARRLKETERQLLQAQKMEAVGRLAGGVAHDFNNILTAILGLAELGAASLPKGQPLRADLEEIRACALRAANLTQQLLAFSRRQIIAPRLIELDDTVLGLGRMLGRVIGEHIQLRVAPAAAGARLMADPGQLEQLLMNLAVNSRDAMPEGGTLTIATARARVEGAEAARLDLAPGDYVSLVVTDDGHGMTEEVRCHIFEPFFTTKEQGKGTGLGLATCYGIVTQNRGAIECQSAPGAGTTFRIHLQESKAAPAAAAVQGPAPLPRGTERVLIVEDEEPVRRLAERVLRKLGYEPVTAPDGDAAIRLARQDGERRIRLVLTDMVMPRMGGRRLAELLAVERPDLRVLFTTGYTDDTIEVPPGLRLLRKPFTGSQLAASVRDCLDAPEPAA